ncbi:TetR/AcrR family transcriptional regulator [Pseudomonas typographi]|uniref:TetR/AcrR family transcriptional regulator n=1 Tax=Pseudomonas typographi TaxID=2715964 RepID=A0ABR7YYU4_9PSED|nr:TetR/AcrR family transcriptional regulator [Pseudomonas typographi]MBD1589098.1 TetR/AcrR family transcriptional regulator [Pseudomonas typographi]MBD1598381.1 TetR/AcrR family transcriptional regulator [Pseudomonas typographi]
MAVKNKAASKALAGISDEAGIAAVRDKRQQSEVAKILQTAALNLFAEQSYSAVTIKDIAKATGMNSALIYYYFGSKEELFLAVIESTVEDAFRQFNSVKAEESDPQSIIALWLQIHILQFALLQKLAKMSLDYAGSPNHTPRIDKAIKKFYDKESVVLRKAIKDGIAHGVFREVDPVQMTSFISTYLDGVLFRSMMFPKFNYKRAISGMRDLLLEHMGPHG